jgi:hypothetical protein
MFTTDSLPHFNPTGHSKDELSMDDIMSLIGKNKDIEAAPTIEYSEEDIKELEDFCQNHGIVGFNCGNMNPKAALEILKGRVGSVENVIKNYESQGWEVVGKDYSNKKQLLQG